MESMVEKMFSVKDKVFFFTGGAGILASTLSYELGKLGARIILTDIAPLDDVLDKFRKENLQVTGYPMDALNKQQIQEVSQKVIQEFGKIDALQFDEVHLLFNLDALAGIHDPIHPVLPEKIEHAV